MTKRLLLLLPTASYRNDDFLAAGRALGVDIVTAADYCHQLAPGWGLPPLLGLQFDHPQQAMETIVGALAAPPDAVLAVDDSGLELAAMLREKWHLPGNPVAAVALTRDKLAFRRLLAANGLNCPAFHSLPNSADPAELLPQLRLPVVVKARRLSASRGVIRADSAQEFLQAVKRVRRIQARADRDSAALGIVVEGFIPGAEYALEGLLEDGRLQVLALFDKPDPLDGPYFEETLYVTPSRLPRETQDQIRDTVARACAVAGLTEGPVHAEMRVNEAGVWLLEVAARSIGGLCGRMLRHALGTSLEEIILRHALRLPPPPRATGEAAGVMMIPIPCRGIYQGVDNVDAALTLPRIVDIQITAVPGQIITPPPEGASYLGFIFSRSATPQQAEAALRHAHALLSFDIRPDIPVTPE